MRLLIATSIAFTCLLSLCSADKSQEDCQRNELFIECGQCEGSCAKPKPVCLPDCRGRRCECIAKNGFVRTKHGHCIKATECPGPSIYSEDPYRGLDRPYAKVNSIGEGKGEYEDTQRDIDEKKKMISLNPKLAKIGNKSLVVMP